MVAKLPLQYVQIGINSLTIVLGILACIPQGSVTAFFDSQCVLNARLSLAKENNTIHIDATNTEWGEIDTCNFTTFTSVVGAIHAFVWSWFFLLMRGSLKADGNEMSILLPTVILHFVMFLVVFAASIILTNGVASFCSNVETQLNNEFTCSESEDYNWSVTKKHQDFYTALVVAKVSIWLMSLTILAQCLAASFGIFRTLRPAIEDFDKTSLTKSESSRSSSYTPVIQDAVSGSMVFCSVPDAKTKSKDKPEKQKRWKKAQPETNEQPEMFIEPSQTKEKLIDV